MALSDDWLADVRRWYFDERDERDDRDGRTAGLARELASGLSGAADPIGYEAALPALQLSADDLDTASDPERG